MISVCVAAFNGEKYIEEQILSVLRNLDSQDEIIISDDGSSDRTRRIVDDLAEKDRRIRIIDGPRKGLIKNFENAIVHSKGDIIFLCDQDDIWMNNKVKQHAFAGPIHRDETSDGGDDDVVCILKQRHGIEHRPPRLLRVFPGDDDLARGSLAG